MRYAFHRVTYFRFLLAAATLVVPPVAFGSTLYNPPWQTDVVPGPLPLTDKPCPSIPAPMVSLDVISVYDQNDKTRSRISTQNKKAYERVVRPMRAYTRKVVKAANRYRRSGGRDVRSALCVGNWLYLWAREGALSDMQSHTAIYNRSTTVASLALAYLQVRPALHTPRQSAQSDATQKWLKSIAVATRVYYQARPKRGSSRSNHRYWAGLSVAATGVATGDRSLFDWGMDSYRIGVCQADKDGVLPLEMKRGGRALLYHFHALQPLVTLAELGERNGLSAYAECDDALHRIISFTLAGIIDPGPFATRANARQKRLSVKELRGKASFLEIYLRRFPERVPPPWHDRMKALRPMGSTPLGGDQTLLYAR